MLPEEMNDWVGTIPSQDITPSHSQQHSKKGKDERQQAISPYEMYEDNSEEYQLVYSKIEKTAIFRDKTENYTSNQCITQATKSRLSISHATNSKITIPSNHSNNPNNRYEDSLLLTLDSRAATYSAPINPHLITTSITSSWRTTPIVLATTNGFSLPLEAHQSRQDILSSF